MCFHEEGKGGEREGRDAKEGGKTKNNLLFSYGQRKLFCLHNCAECQWWAPCRDKVFFVLFFFLFPVLFLILKLS